jgi:hypothetical protein
VIEIPQPGTTEYEKMQGRLGEAAMEFVLNIARQFNQHVKDGTIHKNTPVVFDDADGVGYSSSVNPPEKDHARSTPEIQSHGEGLPRPEPGE